MFVNICSYVRKSKFVLIFLVGLGLHYLPKFPHYMYIIFEIYFCFIIFSDTNTLNNNSIFFVFWLYTIKISILNVKLENLKYLYKLVQKQETIQESYKKNIKKIKTKVKKKS